MPDLPDALRDLAYRWRSLARLSAPAWTRVARSWDVVEARLDGRGKERLRSLRARHAPATEAWPRLLGVRELHEAAYALDVLESIGLASPRPEGRSLDVGSKNGSNLPALAAFAPGPWDLVEVDAHRRYATLSTRRAHGERIARAFVGCRFVAGSVLDLPGPYATITWVLPFVDPGPHAAWGLPRRLFDPPALLAHVREALEPGGTLAVVNQGEVESNLQGRLFAACGMAARSLGRVRSPISPFRQPRYAWRWDKPRSRVHSVR